MEQQKDRTPRKLARHKPVPRISGIYYSELADGTRTYEIRVKRTDPETGKPKRVYEVVGTRLDQAKARRAQLVTAAAKGEKIYDRKLTGDELWNGKGDVVGFKEYRLTKERPVRPATAETQDRHYRAHIQPRFGDELVREINEPIVVEMFLAGLKRKDGKEGSLDPGTKQGIYATLSALLDYAVKVKALSVNPCRQLTRDERPHQRKIEARILTDEEQERLLAYCGGFPWLRPIILVARYAGLRLREIVSVQRRDIDFANNKLTVRRSRSRDGNSDGPPKGGKPATIDMHPKVREAFLEILTDNPEIGQEEPIIQTKLGRHRDARAIQRAFDKARQYAALSEEPRSLRFHDLRHTMISRLANQPGARMPWVQKQARHSDMATTLKYVHEIEDEEYVAAAWEKA